MNPPWSFCLDVAFPESLSHLQKWPESTCRSFRQMRIWALAFLSIACAIKPAKAETEFWWVSGSPKLMRLMCHLGDSKNLITWWTWSTWPGFTRQYPGQRGDWETVSAAVVKLCRGIMFLIFFDMTIRYTYCACWRLWQILSAWCRHSHTGGTVSQSTSWEWKFQGTNCHLCSLNSSTSVSDLLGVVLWMLKSSNCQDLSSTGPSTALLGLRHGCFDEPRGTEHRASLPTLGVCWSVNLRPFISFKKWARDQGKLWDNCRMQPKVYQINVMYINVSIFLSKIEGSSNQASIWIYLIFLGIVYGRPWTVASLWLQLVFCVQLVELEVEVTRSDLAIQTEFDLGTSWNWKSKSTASSIVSYIFILFHIVSVLKYSWNRCPCEPRHLCDCAHGGWRCGRFTIDLPSIYHRFTIDLPSIYHLPRSANICHVVAALWEVSECGMRCRWANP